jgi:hypothetical protein
MFLRLVIIYVSGDTFRWIRIKIQNAKLRNAESVDKSKIKIYNSAFTR